jgi:protein-tyrosine phosphatase
MDLSRPDSSSSVKAPGPSWLQQAAEGVQHWLERVLHPLRRRQVLHRLRAGNPPASVLFVCEGNLYRSPYAQAFLSALAQRQSRALRVGSAGFKLLNRPCPPKAQEIARERGLDLSQHRSTLLSSAEIPQWDLIAVMNSEQAYRVNTRFRARPAHTIVLGDLDPARINRRAIVDPLNAPESVLRESFDRIERCVRALAECWFGKEIGSGQVRPGPFGSQLPGPDLTRPDPS